MPRGRVRPGDRRRRNRRRAAAAARRRRVLHRLLRHGREDRRERRSADDQAPARAGRQGSRLRLRRRRRQGRGRRAWPTARSTTPGSRAARSSASTSTSRSTTRSSTRSSPRCRATGSATRWTKSTYIGAITRRPQLDVLRRRLPTRRRRARSCSLGGSAVQAQGQLVRADGVRRCRSLDGADEGRELRPDHRHPERRRRRGGRRPDERHRIRPDRGRLHARSRARAKDPGAAAKPAASTGTAATA